MNEKLIKDYKTFLDECKTERECVAKIIKDAEKKGYKDIKKCKKLKSGDKVYILSKDNLKVYTNDGSSLTFDQEYTLDKEYNTIDITPNGKIYLSNMSGLV